MARSWIAVWMAVGLFALAALPAGAENELAAARRATAQFHDAEAALAAGYVPASACVSVPSLGTMGFHYANSAYAFDPAIDPTKPELLLYAYDEDGALRLVGAEWVLFILDPSNPPPAPTLFGRTFDGPMPGHEPGMPWHYDLHAWLWARNPAGMFAEFNPAPSVTCGG